MAEENKIPENQEEDSQDSDPEEFSEEFEFTEENPFKEEFNKDDVVNTKTLENEDRETPASFPDPDPESIINYDGEKRKEKYFKYKYGQGEKDPQPRHEELIGDFKDFLIVRKITGNMEGLGNSGRIPAERMTSSGKSVSIEDEPGMPDKHGETTVAVHKNENDEITHIEVFCRCGEKTVIKLDYGDDQLESETDASDFPDDELEKTTNEKDLKDGEKNIKSMSEEEVDEDSEEEIDMDFVDFENVKKKKKKNKEKKDPNIQSEF